MSEPKKQRPLSKFEIDTAKARAGEPPIFDATFKNGTMEQQCVRWIQWSAKHQMALDIERAKANVDGS